MKRLCAVILVLIMLFCSGCEAGKNVVTEDASTMTGTLDEVKDFMFVVTDDQGDSYAFSLNDEKPAGLEKQKVGSRVTVTYTGEISVVDHFEGKVLSVQAAK